MSIMKLIKVAFFNFRVKRDKRSLKLAKKWSFFVVFHYFKRHFKVCYGGRKDIMGRD